MKILYWVPYPEEGPSNRFRVWQYLPFLDQLGYKYRLCPFWNSRAYKILYKNGHYFEKALYFFHGVIGRFMQVSNLFKYDIVFIHREACPLGPPFFEWLTYMFNKPIIFDFDDAIFLKNFHPANAFYRFLKFPSKTKNIIKMSKAIIVANSFLEEYACRFNSSTYVIPTPIDTEKFTIIKKDSEQIVIGWIGSSTTASYLSIASNAIKELSKKYNFTLKLIGARRSMHVPGVNVENSDWSLEREVKDFQSIDIGIYPLPDTLWVKGKAAFKAIQYMAVGVPVIASPVGMTAEVIQDGLNGFLADSDRVWFDKLSRLIESKLLREKIGLAGRKTVEERYSLEANAPKYLEILKKFSM